MRVRSHKRRNELNQVKDFILVENLIPLFTQLFTHIHMNWGKMKFQTDMRFSCEPNLSKAKWISADLLALLLMCMPICNSLSVSFHSCHFDRNEISFRLIKYHVNTNQDEMPAHVHQSFGSFWNAAEMKRHVNRASFHIGLKSQTGMRSFRLSCERTQFLRMHTSSLTKTEKILNRPNTKFYNDDVVNLIETYASLKRGQLLFIINISFYKKQCQQM